MNEVSVTIHAAGRSGILEDDFGKDGASGSERSGANHFATRNSGPQEAMRWWLRCGQLSLPRSHMPATIR